MKDETRDTSFWDSVHATLERYWQDQRINCVVNAIAAASDTAKRLGLSIDTGIYALIMLASAGLTPAQARERLRRTLEPLMENPEQPLDTCAKIADLANDEYLIMDTPELSNHAKAVLRLLKELTLAQAQDELIDCLEATYQYEREHKPPIKRTGSPADEWVCTANKWTHRETGWFDRMPGVNQ